MEDQVVIFKYHYTYAEALVPSVFGLKRMSGYAIEMLYMLEKHFKFKLNFTTGSIGHLDLKKGQFTEGYLRDVRFILWKCY